MKLYIYVMNTVEYLRGDYSSSLTVSDHKDMETYSDWFKVGEVDVDIKADEHKIIQHTLHVIEKKKSKVNLEFSEKLDLLEARKQQLLAITHQPRG